MATATSKAIAYTPATQPFDSSHQERITWTVWAAALATISAAVGGTWDISWHMSIGRDTFWTAPHLLIQLCAAIGGLMSVFLIARATWFGDAADRANSVGVLGLRAPLGA